MTCCELARPFTACLATRRKGRPRCVLTDFCFPLLLTYEYSRLIRSRRLFEARASPLIDGPAPSTGRPGDQAVHAARPASVGSLGFTQGVVVPALPANRTSDTLVASPGHAAMLSPGRRFPRPPRSSCSPLRDEEASSAIQSAFHRQGDTRTLARVVTVSVRSRDAFRDDPALGPSSREPAARRFRARLRELARPPSTHAAPSGEGSEHASLSLRPPADFCNQLHDARAHPFERSILTRAKLLSAFAESASSRCLRFLHVPCEDVQHASAPPFEGSRQ